MRGGEQNVAQADFKPKKKMNNVYLTRSFYKHRPSIQCIAEDAEWTEAFGFPYIGTCIRYEEDAQKVFPN